MVHTQVQKENVGRVPKMKTTSVLFHDYSGTSNTHVRRTKDTYTLYTYWNPFTRTRDTSKYNARHIYVLYNERAVRSFSDYSTSTADDEDVFACTRLDWCPLPTDEGACLSGVLPPSVSTTKVGRTCSETLATIHTSHNNIKMTSR